MRRSPALASLALALAAGLGVSSCGASEAGVGANSTTTSTTEAPPLTGTTQPPTLEQQKAVIAFAPVLAVAPCPAPEPADQPVATDTTIPGPEAGGTPDREGELCYRLGPTGGDGNDLAGAEVSDVAGSPSPMIDVTPQPTSVDRLNGVFDACYRGDPTCPPTGPDGRGALAIVYRGVVVAAPTVNGEHLASDSFVVDGNFTEAEVAELVELLDRTS